MAGGDFTAKVLKLDYFKFYDVANQRVGDRITLQGQFDKEPEVVQVLVLDLFGHVVTKNRESVFEPAARLAWYSLFDPVPEPTRRVVIENQFGAQNLVIGRAGALLVPSRTYGPRSTFPERLDHFKVYRVLDGKPVDKVVSLKDPFGAKDVAVSTPFAFGVPVTKHHGSITTSIQNKDAHLVIYRITPHSTGWSLRARDQFGLREIQASRAVLLAVPSLKRKWSEVR
jgi:hypothetical protein